MRYVSNKFLAALAIFLINLAPVYASQQMTPNQMRDWLKEALQYGFNMKTQDYTKYISTSYIEHIDGKVFNFQQWLHHMSGIKDLMKSYTLTFDEIIAEGDQLAASYVVHATKKDGSKLDIRIIAIFKIKDGKMVYCDELTHVINGAATDKQIGSQD
jgi:hypothetical protein